MPKIRQVLLIALTLSLFSIFIPARVYAYLDPGSGSYVVQILIAAVAGIGYFVGKHWAPVKSFFRKLFDNTPKDEQEKQ